MDRQLIKDLIDYFQVNPNRTPEENKLLTRLSKELSYFPVLSLCRDDLENRGFDTSKVDDSDMIELANQLNDECCEDFFWTDMESIAKDRLKIPQRTITGNYVLVEFPEDPSFFEEHELGYLSFNREDNGAIYVPEHIYRSHFGKEPQANSLYRPIQWPESQEYFDLDTEAAALCEPIEADAKSLEVFGSPSIWVPISLIKD